MLPSEIPKLPTESVSWCLETSPLLRLPSWDGSPSLTLFVSLFIFYILSYLLSKTMGCLSGCLVSSASVQKLFCGIFSTFKWSFNKFVGEKVVSPSSSSTILGTLPPLPTLCCPFKGSVSTIMPCLQKINYLKQLPGWYGQRDLMSTYRSLLWFQFCIYYHHLTFSHFNVLL